MASRLLDYHTHFYHKYQLPVISIIVYPFRTTIATSPLEEFSQGKLILTFHFLVLPLWMEKAQKYLQEHSIALYRFLPAMGGADLTLLSDAVSEMVEYYWDDQPKLASELRWMGIMLRRTDIVPLEDKLIIERRLSMYDDLMEKDPKMQQLFAERKAEGEVKAARMLIVEMVEMRFPLLVELAQKRVNQLSTIEKLHVLFRQINTVRDEQEAHTLLTSPLT